MTAKSSRYLHWHKISGQFMNNYKCMFLQKNDSNIPFRRTISFFTLQAEFVLNSYFYSSRIYVKSSECIKNRQKCESKVKFRVTTNDSNLCQSIAFSKSYMFSSCSLDCCRIPIIVLFSLQDFTLICLKTLRVMSPNMLVMLVM